MIIDIDIGAMMRQLRLDIAKVAAVTRHTHKSLFAVLPRCCCATAPAAASAAIAPAYERDGAVARHGIWHAGCALRLICRARYIQ